MEEKPVYTIYEGSIYYYESVIIEQPAMLFDSELGVLHKIGDLTVVQEAYDRILKQDSKGILTKDMVLFTFDTNSLSKEKIAEEMNKIIGTCDYCKLFYDRLQAGV